MLESEVECVSYEPIDYYVRTAIFNVAVSLLVETIEHYKYNDFKMVKYGHVFYIVAS